MELQKDLSLNYDHINLPVNAESILSNDCWVVNNMPGVWISGLVEPIKFSAMAMICLRSGRASVSINLTDHEIEAPCMIHISVGDILQIKEMSQNVILGVSVFSKKMVDTVMLYIREGGIMSYGIEGNVFPLTPECYESTLQMMERLEKIASDTSAKHPFYAEAHLLATFLFESGYKIFSQGNEVISEAGTQARITEAFLNLVKKHFRQERFLEFYSSKLGITPKHLSRTIRKQTGYTAVDWISRHVILEAKVLLKSSNLTIGEISDNLNFPSQSFFGKYFKRYAKVSPLEYRREQ